MEKGQIRVGINGFGRIGRLVLRAAMECKAIQVKAINDPFMDIEQMIYLLKNDSVHGQFAGKIEKKSDNQLLINGQLIQLIKEREIANIKWSDQQVDYVVESSGVNLTQEKNQGHLKNGAKKVIISAPAKDDCKTVILGVNEDSYSSKDHHVVSNGSCTTNCLAPLVNLLDKELGIKQAMFTTVHSVTSTQQPVDSFSKGGKDLRGGRSIINNIIPSTTGASSTIFKVLPHLKGKIGGNCYRVPTLDVSLVDLNVELEKKSSLEQIYQLVEKYQEKYPRIIGINQGNEVSQDFRGDQRSCIVDHGAGVAVGEQLFKVVAWYDNEWAYSSRVVQLIQHMFSKDQQK